MHIHTPTFSPLQEDVFMSAIAVLRQLLEYPGHALEVARMPNIIKQWEGIAQIILRKIDMEQKYIARLEGGRVVHMINTCV
eukprot:1159576-Pelagomonas_calceolata.AAC.6